MSSPPVVLGHLYAVCAVTVRYTLRCGHCQEEVVKEFRVGAGWEVPWGPLPGDWQVVQGQPVCPRHQVEVYGA